MEKIVIVGDSTASIKEPSARPETGWGEKISRYLPSIKSSTWQKMGVPPKASLKKDACCRQKKNYMLVIIS